VISSRLLKLPSSPFSRVSFLVLFYKTPRRPPSTHHAKNLGLSFPHKGRTPARGRQSGRFGGVFFFFLCVFFFAMGFLSRSIGPHTPHTPPDHPFFVFFCFFPSSPFFLFLSWAREGSLLFPCAPPPVSLPGPQEEIRPPRPRLRPPFSEQPLIPPGDPHLLCYPPLRSCSLFLEPFSPRPLLVRPALPKCS